MIIIGLVKDDVQTAAVGLGNAVVYIFGLAIVVGLNAGLNTFVSQAYGAGQYELCGVYLWRGRIVLIFSIVLISPIFIFSKQILILLKQDPDVSEAASHYMLSLFPGIIMLGFLDLDRNFLTSLNLVEKAMLCQILSPVIHGLVCYYLTITAGYGIVGTGAASFITNMAIWIF